jgi:non-ribosomal peptide synthetase-like protein
MRLPNRLHLSGPAKRTFNPPGRLVALRWLFNVLKMVWKGTVQEMIFWTALKVGLLIYLGLGVAGLLAMMLVLMMALLVAIFAVPVAVKWALIGQYRPGQVYLWSLWMWRNELVYESDTIPLLTFGPLLDGTPWLPMYYRAMGASIGRQVCLHRTRLIECDLVTVGSHATMEGLLQTHLFEDRVMKLGTIHVEEGVSIGNGATVLYGTYVGAWASVGDASLVMKHETLEPGRRYRGLPVENMYEAAKTAPRDAALIRLGAETPAGTPDSLEVAPVRCLTAPARPVQRIPLARRCSRCPRLCFGHRALCPCGRLNSSATAARHEMCAWTSVTLGP